MPERASVFQNIQIGPETTPGTSVAANKLLGSISIEPSPNPEFSTFRPMGTKFPTLNVLNREWSTARLGGMADYNELPYLLASNLVNVSPTTVGTTGRSWVFEPAARAADTVKTYTVEQGDPTRAHKMTYATVAGLELEFSRTGDGIAISGDVIGKALTDGITMTSSPTATPLKPVLPKDVNVYMDSTSAGLGTTKLTRALRATWRCSGRFNPLWVLDKSQTSFVALVEAPPTAEVELLVEADASGMGLFFKDGSTHWLRIEALDDANAGTAIPYKLWLDQAVQLASVSDFSDEDGVFAISYTFRTVFDATWNKAISATVVDTLTAL